MKVKDLVEALLREDQEHTIIGWDGMGMPADLEVIRPAIDYVEAPKATTVGIATRRRKLKGPKS